jgi:hypothetical protein
MATDRRQWRPQLVARIGDEASYLHLARVPGGQGALDVAEQQVERGRHLADLGACVAIGDLDALREHHLASVERQSGDSGRRRRDLGQPAQLAADERGPGERDEHQADRSHSRLDRQVSADRCVDGPGREPGDHAICAQRHDGDGAVCAQAVELDGVHLAIVRDAAETGRLGGRQGLERAGLVEVPCADILATRKEVDRTDVLLARLPQTRRPVVARRDRRAARRRGHVGRSRAGREQSRVDLIDQGPAQSEGGREAHRTGHDPEQPDQDRDESPAQRPARAHLGAASVAPGLST